MRSSPADLRAKENEKGPKETTHRGRDPEDPEGRRKWNAGSGPVAQARDLPGNVLSLEECIWQDGGEPTVAVA
jgi:hypothetical protein